MHAVGLSVDPPSYSHYEPGSSLYGDSDLYYDNLLDPYGWPYNEYHPVSSSKLNANAPEFVLPQEASISNEDTGEELSREELPLEVSLPSEASMPSEASSPCREASPRPVSPLVPSKSLSESHAVSPSHRLPPTPSKPLKSISPIKPISPARPISPVKSISPAKPTPSKKDRFPATTQSNPPAAKISAKPKPRHLDKPKKKRLRTKQRNAPESSPIPDTTSIPAETHSLWYFLGSAAYVFSHAILEGTCR